MRPVLLAMFAAVVLCTPALAVDGTREARGTIAALSDASITIKAGPTSASCALSKYAPALDGYRVGDRVAIVCRRSGNRWWLTKIRKLETKPTGSNDGQKNDGQKSDPPKTSPPVVTFGTLTSLTATSLTVQDGDHSLTCSVDASSPPLGDYHVGDRVYVGCAGGVLVKIAKPKTDTPPPPKTEPGQPVTFGGTLTSLTATGLTVQDGDRTFTCSVGPSSPPLGDYHVGDHVYVACTAGVLVKIVKPETPKPPAPVVTFGGTLTSLTATSLTVQDGDRTFTCGVGSSSPPLGDYHVGDHVYVACSEGLLLKIVKAVTTPPPTTPTITYVNGTISAISTSALVVHSDGGDVTCKLGEKSPGLGDFHVGDHVRAYCSDGVLIAIVRL